MDRPGLAPHTASRSPLPVSGAGEGLWPGMLRRAVAIGLRPADFWALSWREWAWLNGDAASVLPRAALDDLMRRFPDERN